MKPELPNKGKSGRKVSLANSQGNPTKSVMSSLSYADALLIPREISVPFISLVEKWVVSCGMEDCVKRLKSIKTDLIRSHSGLPLIAPYVAKNRRKTKFRGILKAIQSFSFKSDKHFSRALQLLNISSLFYAKKILRSQEIKFLSSVEAEPSPIPHHIIDGIDKASRQYLKPCLKLPKPKSILLRVPSPSRREPLPSGKSIPEDEMPYEVAWEWYNQLVYRTFKDPAPMIGSHDLLALCGRVLNNVVGTKRKEIEDIPIMGRIGFIQEPGLKLRAVANPSRLIQVAIEPLGSYLYSLMDELPWDCTFQQDKAFPIIMKALKDNKVVHSVDLTDASNYFPIDLQEIMLKNVFPNDHNTVNAFLCACKGFWYYKTDTFEGAISWKRGQPLGLYPSFASAFLTHGLLLFYLNGFKHTDSYFVLGDDVVILDNDLYDRYILALEELKCPISLSKSISSSKLAEFAGKVVLPSSVIPQLKWRAPSDDSFIDFVRNIGQKSMFLLKRKQREIAEKMFEVPSFMGGLGFNPKGKPLSDRVFEALTLFGEGMKGDSFLMSYNGLVNRSLRKVHLTKKDSPFLYDLYIEGIPDFDMKSISYVLQKFGMFNDVSPLDIYTSLGQNIASIDSDLPLLRGVPKSRQSLLKVLERKLR
jgi:hypothetical protein